MADPRPRLLTLAPRAAALLEQERPWRGRRLLFGVIGDPVAHSLSPVLQNAALDAEDFVADYVRLRVRPHEIGDFHRNAWSLGLRGFNVTVPHKETVYDLCRDCTQQARRLGAVNTVRVGADGWLGHNTDAEGVAAALRNWDVSPGFAGVVLGAGGSARAALAALVDAGAESVTVCAREGRSRTAMKEWCRTLPGPDVQLAPWDVLALPERQPVVAVACVPEGVPLTTVLGAVRGEALLLDLRYGSQDVGMSPPGWRRQDGRSVLLGQGAAAFGWWFETEPPLVVMTRALAGAE